MAITTRCYNCMMELEEGSFCGYCGYNMNTPTNDSLVIQPGTLLNGYLMGKALNQTEFEVTYIAFDNENNRTVLVKEYLPKALVTRSSDGMNVMLISADKAEMFRIGIEKFKEEVALFNGFKGFSGIIEAYGLFEVNYTVYSVMEYVKGISLEEYVVQKGGKISPEEMQVILLPVTDVIANMHSKNMLHLNISPESICITSDQRVKLMGFGAEQSFTSGNESGQADVNALGATAYYMITGIKHSNMNVEFMNRYKTIQAFKQGLLNFELVGVMTQPAIPIQQPELQPMQQPIQQPMQQPIQQPMQQPVQQPMQQPIQQPVQQPVQQPMQQPTQQPVQQAKPAKKKKKGCLILAIVGILLFLIVGGLGATFILMPTVPDLVGDTEEDAIETLKDSGYGKRDYEIEYEYDDEIEKGEVIEQSPEGGKKTFDKSIELVISMGPEEFELENYVGTTKEEAVEQLEEVNLEVVIVEEYSDQPEGTVISTSPVAGVEVEAEDEVTITISIGVDPNIIHFTDEKFKEAIINYLDLNIDVKTGSITKDMVLDVSVLELTDMGLVSIEGIEVFENLEYLYLVNNELTQIDVSNNSKLKILDAYFNQLTELPVLPMGILELDVSNNQIEDIGDLIKYTELESLDVSYNQIMDLSVIDELPDKLSYINTDGNPGIPDDMDTNGTDTDGIADYSWLDTITTDYMDNNSIIQIFPTDHADYIALINGSVQDITDLFGTMEFEEKEDYSGVMFDVYSYISDSLSIDFYIDHATQKCSYYDVWNLSDLEIFSGEETISLLENNTPEDVMAVLGVPSEIYVGYFAYLDYYTTDAVYEFVFYDEGIIDSFTVYSNDYYFY